MASKSRRPAKRRTPITRTSSLRSLHGQLVEAESRRRAGQLTEAERICRSLLAEHPTYLGALQTFGLVSLEKNNYPQAVTCFLTAAAEAPNDWTNYTNLAAAWLGLEVPQMAALMLREARMLNPQDPEVHFMLGEVFAEDREYEDAMLSYREALHVDPDHKLALFKLSDCYINLGYFEEARAHLFRLHKLQPDAIAVINLLFQLPENMVDLDFEAAIKQCQKTDTETQAEYTNNKAFVLAAVKDRKGDHENAWKTIASANAAIYPEHGNELKSVFERRAKNLEAARSIKTANLIQSSNKAKCDGPVPLFIQGVSRSGKTTLETLLGSHPDIKRGYENHAVEFATTRASQMAGLISIRHLPLLPGPLLPSFAEHFREKMVTSSGGKKVVTNTNPGIIGSMGKVAEAVPEARFIFLTRNRNDAALRIFMKKYKSGNHHAYNLSTIYQYIDWYEAMIEALEAKLGTRAISVKYEDLICHPSSIAQCAFKLCGLDGRSVELPEIGSDVGAAKPYECFMHAL